MAIMLINGEYGNYADYNGEYGNYADYHSDHNGVREKERF